MAGIEAAIGLYEEAAEVGFFTNFTQTDLARSDSPYLYASGIASFIYQIESCVRLNSLVKIKLGEFFSLSFRFDSAWVASGVMCGP